MRRIRGQAESNPPLNSIGTTRTPGMPEASRNRRLPAGAAHDVVRGPQRPRQYVGGMAAAVGLVEMV